jgi:hypothetical protein
MIRVLLRILVPRSILVSFPSILFSHNILPSACKNRFMKLMTEHKVCRSPVSSISAYIFLQKGETESRVKTGAVEEVSEHIKVCS